MIKIFLVVGALFLNLFSDPTSLALFEVPSPTELVSRIAGEGSSIISLEAGKVDKILNRFIKKKKLGEKEKIKKLEKLEEIEVYYLASLFLRYAIRGEITFQVGQKENIEVIKDRWADKALRWARKTVKDDLDDVAEGKVVIPSKYLSNLASIYAIKVTYSSFPFLIAYVKKLMKIVDLPIKQSPFSFEYRVARVVNYSVSSYTFYKEGKKKLDEDMAALNTQYLGLTKKIKDRNTQRQLLDRLNRARLAAATYYFKEVENTAESKRWLAKVNFNLEEKDKIGTLNQDWQLLVRLRTQQQTDLLKAIEED